jgi:hypothetical protein
MFEEYSKGQNQHLTNGNCYAACSATRVPENASRAIRPLWRFLPLHFVGCWNYYVIPLSQPPKRQLPRTLGEIIFEFFVKKEK